MRIPWVAVVAGAVSLLALPVSGQSFEGTWRTGDTRVEVSVESWGENCARRPKSHTIAGGSHVEIVSAGDDLRIKGKRTIETGTCWSDNPSLEKTASLEREGLWRTVCRTTENDPRQERGEYTLRVLGPDRLQYRDVSHYDWQLKGSRCAATITTTQLLTRVDTAPSADTSERAVPAAESEQETEAPCEPGAPDELSLLPRDATLNPGDRLCFRTRVVDAQGCEISKAKVRWQLRRPDGVKASLRGGCFETPPSSAEAEGRYTVLARSGPVRASSEVTVEAIDLSSLIAKRTETGAIVGSAPATEDVTPQATTGRAAGRVSAHTSDTASAQALRWPWLAGGLAAMLATTAGIIIWLRRRRSHKRAHAGSARPDGSAPQEPQPPEDEPRAPLPTPPAGPHTLICPQCRHGYPQGSTRCPRDDAVLMSYTEFQEQARQRAYTRTQRCPRCGARYGGDVTFCGSDGTKLIAVG